MDTRHSTADPTDAHGTVTCEAGTHQRDAGPPASRRLVVLINPAPLHNSAVQGAIRSRYPYPPLGLLSLAGLVLAHGYDVEIIDFFREDLGTKSAFLGRLSSLGRTPVLVGLCTYTETVMDAALIARTVRDVFPPTRIVFGGPHATFCAEDILATCPWVDFVVRNEGEATLVELLEHVAYPESFPVDAIPGVTSRRPDGTFAAGPQRGFVSHLDCLALPPYHLLPGSVSDTGDVVFVFMTSRGCPGNCVFCASRAFSGSRYRLHSAEWLISLMAHERDRIGFVAFGVMDDTFLVNRERLKRFCSYLRQIGFKGPWTCKSRVDTIDAPTLQTLKSAGCKSIHIGVESADDDVLKGIDKRITLERVLSAIVLMKQHRIRPECSFILGHHNDTHETMEKTLLLARAIRDHNIGMSVVGVSTPLPGTPLHNRAADLGVRLLTRDWRRFDLSTPVIETDRFSADDLKRAQFFFDIVSRSDADGVALYAGDLSAFRARIARFVADATDAPRVRMASLGAA